MKREYPAWQVVGERRCGGRATYNFRYHHKAEAIKKAAEDASPSH